MKAQAFAERHNRHRLVTHEAYHSLIGRAYEDDLMPLAADQKLGALVLSPLGWDDRRDELAAKNPYSAAASCTRLNNSHRRWWRISFAG